MADPEDLLSDGPSPVPPPSPGFERLAALHESRWVQEYGVEFGMWHGPSIPKEMMRSFLEGLEGTAGNWSPNWYE